jgi:hypothetical protein
MPSGAKVLKAKTSSSQQQSEKSTTTKEPKDIALRSESASASGEKDFAQPVSGNNIRSEWGLNCLVDPS